MSGYYAWLRRAPSRRSQENTGLGERSRRIHAVLHAEGQACGKKRVARLMRERGLSVKPRKHRTRTTDSRHEQPVAPNLLNREFSATAPNTKWVTDITAIWTTEGWLYLAIVLDIFSRMVVATDYRELLAQYGIIVSMSGKDVLETRKQKDYTHASLRGIARHTYGCQ